MGYDDASCEYCLGVFPGAFAFRCVADFVAAVCESAGQWNLGDDEFSGIQGLAILRLLATGITWVLLERIPEEIDKYCQTRKGLCLAAAGFVVIVTVIEFSWLGMMASGGENAFIYFRF